MFRGEQQESPLRLHVSKFLDTISGRKKSSSATSVTETTNPVMAMVDQVVAEHTEEDDTHIQWTVGAGLATISLSGPTADGANVGFVMRNTCNNLNIFCSNFKI